MKRLLTVLILITLTAGVVQATPYVDPQELHEQAELRARTMPRGPMTFDGILDNRNVADSVLTVEYRQLLDWLTTMQELSPGADFGGMHEGETTTWDIVQTDNTQEALRDWSHYARMTGDLDRYAVNVDAAWTYTLNNPAYLEEGGGDPNYYRVHNCGWALVAAMEYTEAYGEDDDYLAYADSCARYLDTWRLTWPETGVYVNPLSASFGAGALHTYALWRDNAQWEIAAEEIAMGVKQWIEADPDRLNYNEVWAMSGGTAMWGIITALFLDNVPAGEAWLPNYLPSMDSYSGSGQWNNSWTVWYGFAWNRAHDVLNTQETLDNAIVVADYMLAQGDLDDDAGVPGTEGLNQDDQSWTSAYQVWYELEQLIHRNPEGPDPTALGLVGMPDTWPLIVGMEMPVAGEIANAGLLPSPPDNLICSLTFTLPDQMVTVDNIPVPFGTKVSGSMGMWTPQQAGTITISMEVSAPGDVNLDNNTFSQQFTVYPARTISGVMLDSLTNEPIEGEVHWTQLDLEPTREGSVAINPSTGEYSFTVAEGTYELYALPNVTPYPPRTVQVTVTNSDVDDVDFLIPASPVMYVTTNAQATSDTLLLNAFAANGLETFVWNYNERGLPGADILTEQLDVLIWSVEQGSDLSFDPDQWNQITSFLADEDNRSGMLFSGDGVMHALSEDQRSQLGVELGIVDQIGPIIAGMHDAVLPPSDSLFVGGILPQQAVDEVIPSSQAAESIGIALGPNVSAGALIDRWAQIGIAVFSFSVEGINDLDGRFMAREEFVGRLLDWFGTTTEVAESGQVSEPLPDAWSLRAWPNPFNPSLHIEVNAAAQTNLVLFDILGREVTRWNVKGNRTLHWDATGLATGMYFLRLDAGPHTRVQKLVLLR
ncbi:T9SS type A sorting domain-containing protein [bacterium]|nr:T9SS type A sorting domain-containing protein [bacterium]